MDIYPTLAELCGMSAPADLEGISLARQLRRPAAKKRPAVSTYRPNNHAVVTDKWRYIRYRDGTEELYDRVNEPNDWTNLADRPEHYSLKRQLAHWMPENSVPHTPARYEYDFDFDSYSFKLK